MLRNTALAGALAAFVSFAPAPALAGIDDGLVASYTFDDGTAADVSGNGNHGYVVGDVTFVEGQRGTAAKLGGVYSRGYVNVPNSPTLTFVDDYTFSAWFYLESNASMDGYGRLTDYGVQTVFGKSGDRNGLDVRAFRSTTDGLWRVMAFDGWCCGGGASIGAAQGFAIGEWHHVAITSGGGAVRLYFDGVLAGELPTATFAVNPAMASQPLQLGIDQAASWYPLDGMLDEVRVYRRAISAAEAATLANRDLAGPQIQLTTPADGADYLLGASILADWTATDAGSGVCSQTGTVAPGAPIDTATLGDHLFSVTAADCAGNEASAQATYHVRYAFGGFLPPLRDDGSGIYRKGSTIPVKLQLTDAAGAPITTAVVSLGIAPVADGIAGTVEEAVSTSAATEGNLFRYDADSAQYVFNLSTAALEGGKTYQITASLDDGSSKSVIVSIR